MKTIVIAGTKKGVFIFTSADRAKWDFHGPFQPGREIHHAVYDPRSGRIYATANDAWFGCQIVWSADLGVTWESATQNPVFPESSGLKLDKIWHLEPGLSAEPNVLYAGVAPAALFRTEDAGQTWTEVTGLTSHPTRKEWHPGAGGLCLHSIALDKSDPRHFFVGISAVGVFRTTDRGETFQTVNRGTRAEFMPEKYPEYGQCVHKLLMAPGQPSLLFQQNHCGVYRSADNGATWQEITAGLPSDFGFPLAIHPRDRETIYVIPLKGAEFRCPVDNKMRVFRSRDGGGSWTPLTEGLPQANAFMGVYREGLAVDSAMPAGIYFGTGTGKLYSSADEGDTWSVLADNLPPIYSVEAASI